MTATKSTETRKTIKATVTAADKKHLPEKASITKAGRNGRLKKRKEAA